MRLRRWAIAIPAVKASICAAIGLLALTLALTLRGGQYDLLPVALGIVSMPVLLGAITYVLAAFLLSRGGLVWRSLGASLEVAATLVIAWQLIQLHYALWDIFRNSVWIALPAIWAAPSVLVVAGAFWPISRDGRALPSPTGSVDIAKR